MNGWNSTPPKMPSPAAPIPQSSQPHPGDTIATNKKFVAGFGPQSKLSK